MRELDTDTKIFWARPKMVSWEWMGLGWECSWVSDLSHICYSTKFKLLCLFQFQNELATTTQAQVVSGWVKVKGSGWGPWALGELQESELVDNGRQPVCFLAVSQVPVVRTPLNLPRNYLCQSGYGHKQSNFVLYACRPLLLHTYVLSNGLGALLVVFVF